MVNIRCEVDYRFENGFILGEEHLHTLSGKIRERYPEEELLYRVTRIDSYVYTTSDVNDVVNEENGSSNYIKKLEIIIHSNENINLNLCFEKNEDSTLKITGTDRDRIYLLYNDIKTYVTEDITTVKLFMKKKTLFNAASLSIIPMTCVSFLFFLFLKETARYQKAAKDALSSQDLIKKINFLIEEKINSSMAFNGKSSILIPLMFVTLLLLYLPILYYTFMGKRSMFRITDYFLFGKQKSIYENKVKIKNQVVWTVCIGLIISVIAGLIVYILTK